MRGSAFIGRELLIPLPLRWRTLTERLPVEFKVAESPFEHLGDVVWGLGVVQLRLEGLGDSGSGRGETCAWNGFGERAEEKGYDSSLFLCRGRVPVGFEDAESLETYRNGRQKWRDRKTRSELTSLLDQDRRRLDEL